MTIKDTIIDLYYNQHLSVDDICKEIDRKPSTVYRYIRDDRYPINKVFQELTPEILYHLYVEKELSIRNIQRQIGHNKRTIKKALENFKIPIRTKNKINSLIKDRVNNTYNEDIKNDISKKVKLKYNMTDIRGKQYKTKSLNNSWNISKSEEIIYCLLLEHFSKEDILRQYKSDLYPYPCDFYIKSLDLYIEFQGTWCHGDQPFNDDNPIHQKLVKKWEEKGTEYFLHAIKTWTKADPEKRRIAKENNLNWKEFFNLEDLKEWLNTF